MACPACLEVKGRQEFESRHLAVMLDAWLKTTYNTTVGKCMRCDRKYKKLELSNWPTLKERNFSDNNKNVFVRKIPKPVSLEAVIDGVEIPYGPGVVVPLTELPETHPAWQYILNRKTLDVETLIRDFHPGFCVKERPQSEELGIFYKRTPNSRNTPQGRIVFHSYCNGHLQAWQSRLIDQTTNINGGKLTSILHPDTHQFIPVTFSMGDQVSYIAPNTSKNKLPTKYYNGRFHKHKLVFGYDAYAKHNKDVPYDQRVIFVAEGILDAVQVGGDGVACLGKQICPEQVPLLLSLSPKIVFMVQNDEPSESGFRSNEALFRNLNIEIFRVTPPDGFNDFGDMPYTQVKEYVASFYT